MTSSALIDTTNRLLGWSINDFGLYGGQVAVAIGAPATHPPISNALSVPDPNVAVSRVASSEGAPRQMEASEARSEPHGDTPSAFHSTPFAPAPIQFGDPVHANAFEFHVPTATGNGSSAMPALEAFHAPEMVPTAMPTGLAPPTLATEMPEVAAPALASVSGLVAPVLALNETLDHTLSPTISAVSNTADTVLGQAQQTIDALPQVSEIIAADGFLGSDPVAGVATLVSMVDSTDAFDLANAGVDVPEVAATGSILDTLADEAVAGPLLGDVEHGVDTLLPDPQHDGVTGLL